MVVFALRHQVNSLVKNTLQGLATLTRCTLQLSFGTLVVTSVHSIQFFFFLLCTISHNKANRASGEDGDFAILSLNLYAYFLAAAKCFSSMWKCKTDETFSLSVFIRSL